MQLFSGIDYQRIDIANSYGKDKWEWNQRIDWVHENERILESKIDEADDKYAMAKAVYAYRDIQAGKPVGHNMHLDCTASGLQIIACLTGCYETAKHVNLINTGKREDVYTHIVDRMNMLLDPVDRVRRLDVKKPLMSHYFCKSNQSKAFNPRQESAFYEAIQGLFPGAERFMRFVRKFWNPKALEHSWTLPDGHRAVCRVTELVGYYIPFKEYSDNYHILYTHKENVPSTLDTPLVANVTHSCDGYIAREMVRKANKRGFDFIHNHDGFYALPKYMNIVRQNYKDILCEIADSNLLQNILSEIAGYPIEIEKMSEDLSTYIANSEYALS